MSAPVAKEHDFPELEKASIPLETSGFFNQIIRELSGALQDIVGLNEAEGFITLVANRIGEQINTDYKNALHVDQIPKQHISDVLIDLKRRIEGKFTVEHEDDKIIILRNTRCPFGDNVLDRPALCMMTTNVFGRIAADSNGYARVDIDKSIARRDHECRVIIHLVPDEEHDSRSKEFYKVR
ncbi:methanogen output domain 1-containing protein [Roseibium sp. Sym1]|uniref:methanogen output domain 1-containing protein n=1 Tax=Roseibium sp. Sym1 TaxID=3016006 RepID=UPI0022B30A60|nr:methanogen output domain 1-containing protein [Roseibium sp. Sym1]